MIRSSLKTDTYYNIEIKVLKTSVKIQNYENILVVLFFFENKY